MYQNTRKAFPYVVLLCGFSALAWAVSFGTLPRADFSFNNEDEVRTVDPAKATGNPEGRIIDALFEGLYRKHPVGYELSETGQILSVPTPDQTGTVPTEAIPGTAESCDISEDGRTYTFHIRPTARWSDGSPVTSHDYRWSWRRTLHPETLSRYPYQLFYVVGAQAYNEATFESGDRIEVELADRKDIIQPFPRGTIVRGILKKIIKPPEPDLENLSEDKRSAADAAWRDAWVYLVEQKPVDGEEVLWDSSGEILGFCKAPEKASDVQDPELTAPLQKCVQVLTDFDSTVGLHAPDDRTLVVELNNPTPFFLDLVAFYPLYPVNRRCIEEHGVPNWTKAENIVSNGPFQLEFRRLRDRVRMKKNQEYWNADIVELETIDAMAVKSQTTGLNMYLDGQLDWSVKPPDTIVPRLQGREDFVCAPSLITYFYRLNVTRPPLDDVHVRRALNMAIDKRLICENVTKAGQQPARNLVPPGLAGYTAPLGDDYDPEGAKAELAKSKYVREGQNLPTIEILYNTQESHRAVAEVIQQQWKNALGITVELKNTEWASYLNAQHTMQYTVARAGWIGDYPDPNTFLDMWVTGGDNNETGWSSATYDRLIRDAQAETEPERRMQILAEAEALLVKELPIIPIYFYVMPHMLNPRVVGFYANAEDRHPLHLIRFRDSTGPD